MTLNAPHEGPGAERTEMNWYADWLRSESTAGGTNWNAKMIAAANEIDELSSEVRECRKALNDLLDKRPMLAAMLCGSTTLGNLLVDLDRAVNGMTLNGQGNVQAAPTGGANEGAEALEKAIAILQEVQFSGGDMDNVGACPMCAGMENEGGHEPHCQLAALLRELEPNAELTGRASAACEGPR